MPIGLRDHIWYSVLFHWSVCCLNVITVIFLIALDLQCNLKPGLVVSTRSIFRFWIISIQGLFGFHVNFEMTFYVCVELHWNYGRDFTESVDCFSYVAHFTLLILPIPWELFIFSVTIYNYFLRCLNVFIMQSFTLYIYSKTFVRQLWMKWFSDFFLGSLVIVIMKLLIFMCKFCILLLSKFINDGNTLVEF